MKYYYIVDDGIHEVIKFDNDGKVHAAFLMNPLPDNEEEREVLPEFTPAMVELSDSIKDVVKNGKILYEFWTPGLTEEEYDELLDLSMEYDSPEDFIEGYLSAGYEYWTDTIPEKDEPDNKYEQEVYEYLRRAWENAHSD